jgi:hypothetical protein
MYGKPGCVACANEARQAAENGYVVTVHRVPIDCYTEDDLARWAVQRAEGIARHAAAQCKACDDTGEIKIEIERWDYGSVPCAACRPATFEAAIIEEQARVAEHWRSEAQRVINAAASDEPA